MHCIKTGLGAQCAHPEPRSRAHCARSAHVIGAAAHSKLVARMSRAQPAQVARMLGVHLSRHAQAACPLVATSLRCRDIKATKIMSRHQIDVTTPLRTLQVATSKRGRDTKPPPCSLNHVATSNRCRDTPQAYPGRDTKTWSRPSCRLAYVATSNSCRDTVSAHSGLSRSRHRNPCRDLPHCHPCRDMRRRFLLTKVDQVATPLPGRDLTLKQTQSYPQLGRDTKRMSRHQLLQSSFCFAQKKFFFFFSNPPVAFLLLLRCSSLTHCIHTTSNIFIKIILFNLL